jgi:uncharacterized protein
MGLRRGCLRLLLIGGLLVSGLIGASTLFFKPLFNQVRSTSMSPDGRFKIVVKTVPMLVAMPGQGSDAPGTLYLYDAAGRELDRADFEMVQLVRIDWQTNQVAVGVANWDLPKTDDPNLLLFQAAMQGDQAKFGQLLPQANPQFRTAHQRTLLHAAALDGNLAIMRQLLEKEIDVNAQDVFGDTALQLAVNRNLQFAVDLLLEHKANVNVRNQAEQTPLLTALESGYRDLAKRLIAEGSEINAVNQSGCSALYLAANLGDLELLNQLLNRGASVTVNHLSPLTAVLDSKATVQEKQQIIELLLAKGMSFEAPVLHHAIYQGDAAMVTFLIKRGANVNHRGYADDSLPLSKAAVSPAFSPTQRQVILSQLLAAGAEINAQDGSGYTALADTLLQYSPAQFGIVEYLLTQGADVNLANRYQFTPLMLAVQTPYANVSSPERLKLIDLLLTHGADVKAQNQQGKQAVDLTSDPAIRNELRKSLLELSFKPLF